MNWPTVIAARPNRRDPRSLGKETRVELFKEFDASIDFEMERVRDLRPETPQSFIHLAAVEIFVLPVPILPLEEMP
jgi:hypothetical protein